MTTSESCRKLLSAVRTATASTVKHQCARWRGPIGFAFGALVVSLFAARPSQAQASTLAKRPQANRVRVLPPLEQPTHQVVVLAVTSSSCGFAARDSFKLALFNLMSAVRAYAQNVMPNAEVQLSGVSIDHDPEVGLAALRKLGAFDEMSVGRSWLNSQVIRFGLRDFPHRLATPSVVIFARRVTTHQKSIEVGLDSILARADGAAGIEQLRWRVTNRIGEFVEEPISNRVARGVIKP